MVDAGTAITYHISSGASQKVIPNVVGDSEVQRAQAPGGRGLCRERERGVLLRPEDTVTAVSPGVGESAAVGSTVTITVSAGVQYVSVTNVIGWTGSQAQTALENSGFVVSISGPRDGIVVSQSATGSAPYGSTITLTTEAQQTQLPEDPETPSQDGSGSDTTA